MRRRKRSPDTSRNRLDAKREERTGCEVARKYAPAIPASSAAAIYWRLPRNRIQNHEAAGLLGAILTLSSLAVLLLAEHQAPTALHPPPTFARDIAPLHHHP